MAAARFPWRDAFWVAMAGVGCYTTCRASLRALRDVYADRCDAIRRHQANRAALARATRPRVIR